MFLIKRAYFNKTNIIKGLIIALLFSAFIYLGHFEIYNKFLNSIFALFSLYFILQSSRITAFYIGFFIGIFWFYWIGISFQYYNLSYLIPLVIISLGLLYGLIFYIICFFKSTIIRAILIFSLSYLHPFGFNWFIPELALLDTFFFTSKEHFAIILASLVMIIELKKYKFLAIIPLYFALSLNQNVNIVNPNIKIDIPQLDTPQDKKWMSNKASDILSTNLDLIENSIKNKNELIILPETVFPLVLNRNDFLMEKLLEKSFQIDILAGSLYYEDKNYYNATFFFSKGEFRIAKKLVLVPFGEEIPLPKFFVDLINDTFYNGAQDYKKANKATDFNIKGTKFRNAICYEATSEEIYQNLNGVKYMIATSNNAWFTPSIEPTLQKLILRYYAKKYDITIFYSVNGSKNYIVRP